MLKQAQNQNKIEIHYTLNLLIFHNIMKSEIFWDLVDARRKNGTHEHFSRLFIFFLLDEFVDCRSMMKTQQKYVALTVGN